jgi:hypothetical protein
MIKIKMIPSDNPDIIKVEHGKVYVNNFGYDLPNGEDIVIPVHVSKEFYDIMTINKKLIRFN